MCSSGQQGVVDRCAGELDLVSGALDHGAGGADPLRMCPHAKRLARGGGARGVWWCREWTVSLVEADCDVRVFSRDPSGCGHSSHHVRRRRAREARCSGQPDDRVCRHHSASPAMLIACLPAVGSGFARAEPGAKVVPLVPHAIFTTADIDLDPRTDPRTSTHSCQSCSFRRQLCLLTPTSPGMCAAVFRLRIRRPSGREPIGW